MRNHINNDGGDDRGGGGGEGAARGGDSTSNNLVNVVSVQVKSIIDDQALAKDVGKAQVDRESAANSAAAKLKLLAGILRHLKRYLGDPLKTQTALCDSIRSGPPFQVILEAILGNSEFMKAAGLCDFEEYLITAFMLSNDFQSQTNCHSAMVTASLKRLLCNQQEAKSLDTILSPRHSSVKAYLKALRSNPTATIGDDSISDISVWLHRSIASIRWRDLQPAGSIEIPEYLVSTHDRVEGTVVLAGTMAYEKATGTLESAGVVEGFESLLYATFSISDDLLSSDPANVTSASEPSAHSTPLVDIITDQSRLFKGIVVCLIWISPDTYIIWDGNEWIFGQRMAQIFACAVAIGAVSNGLPTERQLLIRRYLYHERMHRDRVGVTGGEGEQESTRVLPTRPQNQYCVEWNGIDPTDVVGELPDKLDDLDVSILIVPAGDRLTEATFKALIAGCAKQKANKMVFIVAPFTGVTAMKRFHEKVISATWGPHLKGFIDEHGIIDPLHPFTLAFFSIQIASAVAHRGMLSFYQLNFHSKERQAAYGVQNGQPQCEGPAQENCVNSDSLDEVDEVGEVGDEGVSADETQHSTPRSGERVREQFYLMHSTNGVTAQITHTHTPLLRFIAALRGGSGETEEDVICQEFRRTADAQRKRVKETDAQKPPPSLPAKQTRIAIVCRASDAHDESGALRSFALNQQAAMLFLCHKFPEEMKCAAVGFFTDHCSSCRSLNKGQPEFLTETHGARQATEKDYPDSFFVNRKWPSEGNVEWDLPLKVTGKDALDWCRGGGPGSKLWFPDASRLFISDLPDVLFQVSGAEGRFPEVGFALGEVQRACFDRRSEDYNSESWLWKHLLDANGCVLLRLSLARKLVVFTAAHTGRLPRDLARYWRCSAAAHKVYAQAHTAPEK